MFNNLIRNTLQQLYENKNNIIFHQLLTDMDSIPPALASFHMSEGYILKDQTDDYFCGIRSSSFVIEYGSSEMGTYMNDKVVLITGNHKGHRSMTMLRIPNN